MKIIVCIKQVPDTNDVRINPETNTLIREGVESIINPFDTYAIEEAIRLKEKHGGEAIAITMGPPQAEAALREAISLGLDDGILVSDRAFAGSDTWATSYTLSQAIKKIKDFDLIICGKQAADGDTAQVGPGISQWLDIPQITYVKKIKEISDVYITAERMTETGYEVVKAPLPALITVVKEINDPRLPSLRGKMKAKKAEIAKWGVDAIEADHRMVGLNASPTQVVRIFSPEAKGTGEILKGEKPEVVKQLIEKLGNLPCQSQ